MKGAVKNHKGFTLIELIVVVSILSILAGAVLYSVNSVSSTRARRFSSELSALLSECRINTLSGAAAPVYLKLCLEDGTYYGVFYEDGAERKRQALGDDSLSCTVEADGSVFSVSAAEPTLCLAFSRYTGAFLKLEDVTDSGGVLNGTHTGYCTAITVSAAGGHFTLQLIPETGYHTVSR